MIVLLVGGAALRAEVGDALAYLEREVPKWKRENKCYACHNNGDGLRALLAAKRSGFAVNRMVLTESLGALRVPAEWESKPLARLQFAAAVREAVEAGLLEHEDLSAAAAAVAADQQDDGHWKVDEELAAGSPVTYGAVLATYLARTVLQSAGGEKHAPPIRRANEWLERREPGHVIELAALVLALGREADRRRLTAAQLKNGSWNNEPFDTAVARLALGAADPAAAEFARQYLLRSQWSGGGWPATTRPAGGDSYAQHISTTAWVVLSLTAPEPR